MHIAARLAIDYCPEVQPAKASRRKAKREETVIATKMRTLGYHGSDVVVRNISEQGFMAEAREDFVPGSHVRLRLPAAGVMLARVIWMKRGEVGCEFFNPLPEARLRLVLGQRGLA